MRFAWAAALLVLGSSQIGAGTLRWPDPDIPVPDLVRAFILAECHAAAGTTDEALHACIAGESFGYRATVMMLSDPLTGEEAADRYRICRAGLGMHGGRFHRRRAECIGGAFAYHWRFEDTKRASIEETDSRFRTAVAGELR